MYSLLWLLKNVQGKIRLMSIFVVIVSTLLLISSLFSIVYASEEENLWSGNVKLTYDAINPHPKDIVVDGNNIHIVWGEDRNNASIIYKRSEDGGRTWTNDISLDSISVAGPTIAVSGDNIFVAWTKDCGTTEANFDIYSTRSNDGGKTWEKEKKLIDGSEWAAVPIVKYSGNILHLIWEGDGYLRYMKSADNGATWTEPKTISNTKIGYLDMGVNENNVHVVWTEMNSNYLYYRKSVDNGDTWDNIKGLGCTSFGPHIAVDENIIHIIYFYTVEMVGKIYYLRSIDNGETWNESEKFGDILGAVPRITTSNGTVNIVYETTVNGNMEIYYRKSVDGGVHWSDDTRLTFDEDDSFDPVIATDHDYVYVVWADYNFTENWCYVYFKRTVPYLGFLTENTSLPVIHVISPNRWDIVDNIVWINGTAYATNPNLTIQKIEIRFSDLGEWQTANGTANWSYCWNTTNEHDGYHQLFIRAYDGASYSEYYVLPLYVRTEGGGGLIIDTLSFPPLKLMLVGIGVFIAIILTLVYLARKSKK